jgi:hypothetical protein
MFLPETISPLVRYLVYFLVVMHLAVALYYAKSLMKSFSGAKDVSGAKLWAAAQPDSKKVK